MSWKASGAAKDITHGTNGQKISMADKCVLMVLSDYWDERRQYAWPSQETLAEQCICTERGMRGILYRLQSFGLINIVQGGRSGNKYLLLFVQNYRNGVPVIGNGLPERKNDLPEPEGILPEPAGAVEPLEPTGLTTISEILKPCEKCGHVNPEHKCPGYLTKRQRAKNQIATSGERPRKQFGRQVSTETERPPKYVDRPRREWSNSNSQPADDDGPVKLDDDYPRLKPE